MIFWGTQSINTQRILAPPPPPVAMPLYYSKIVNTLFLQLTFVAVVKLCPLLHQLAFHHLLNL